MVVFEWDQFKAETNYRKHKVSFELAQLFLDDPFHITEFDRTVNGEDRYYTLAKIGRVIVFIVHCYRENKHSEEIIRIISARKAETREAGRYYKQTGP